VLIMTPLTLALADALKLERQAKLAFLLATGYVVDSTSLPFTISNLTNIVVANYFGIGFAEYAARMVPVNLVAFAASLGALWVLFRGVVPARVDLSRLDVPRSAVLDPLVFALGWIVLPLLFAGYFLAKPLGLPLCAVAGAGAGVLLLAALHGHLARARVRAGISVVTILREAPWAVVWFSLGMYLIVFGLRNHGATQPVVVLLEALQGTPALVAALVSGTVFAILAAVMNNLPAVLFGSLAIEQARLGEGARELFVYANVIGAGLGPKMTPIGSLATLLWMHVLAQYGVRVGWRRFCLVGLKLTIPVLAATLAGLAAVLALRASVPS
jgi:arsenical pump membrane protein